MPDFRDPVHAPFAPEAYTPSVSRGPRSFTDSVGTSWSVHEIVSRPMSPGMSRLLGGDRRVGGWLLFRTEEGERRRLAPYPDDWLDISDWMLERWCMRAKSVPPAPERRAADQEPPA